MPRSLYQPLPRPFPAVVAHGSALEALDMGGVGSRPAIDRARQLMTITAAIADAVGAEPVLDALVNQTAAVLGARRAGLWRVSADGSGLQLARSVGVPEALEKSCRSCRLDRARASPAVDAVRLWAAVWIHSWSELAHTYPGLAAACEGPCSVACLPLVFEDQARGCLALWFPDERLHDAGERDLLLLVARYAGQALERLRLLENERALRAANEQARVRAEVLYQLAAGVIGAETVEAVFDVALDGIERALGATRCAILAFDADDVMRFKAWRGLSQGYRDAVEGHSPWRRDTPSPKPLVVSDVRAEPSLAPYMQWFGRERIGALGFIPLSFDGRVIGKFMVYYPEPRTLSTVEIDTAEAIANHVAAVMGRFAALHALERAVCFNELFTGMLGHDLRNPLGAIMAATDLCARQAGDGPLHQPLARIQSSGRRMAAMIEQLLDFTRVRVGGGIPVEPRPADLGQIVNQAVDELRGSHDGRRFDVRLLAPDAAGEWDTDRILQVFSNLVANAVQHGDPEQGVDVRVDGRAPGSVLVSVHNAGAIAAELLPLLFEPMAGGTGCRSKSRGLGLGLYISREIVSAHGGSIEVESSPESGTTFTVRLPRHTTAVDTARATARQ